MGLMDSRKAKERDLVMLAEQARQKQAQGLSQFVVHFSTGYGNSFDRRTRLDAAMETLEDLGIEVANVEDQEWEYRWTISCRNPPGQGGNRRSRHEIVLSFVRGCNRYNGEVLFAVRQ